MAKEEVVVVLEIVVEDKEIMSEIMEEAEQAEEVKQAEILKEETVEEVEVETVAEEGWRLCLRRRRSRR